MYRSFGDSQESETEEHNYPYNTLISVHVGEFIIATVVKEAGSSHRKDMSFQPDLEILELLFSVNNYVHWSHIDSILPIDQSVKRSECDWIKHSLAVRNLT